MKLNKIENLAESPDTIWRKIFSEKIVNLFFHTQSILSIFKNGKAQTSFFRHTMI